jgi:hypothetical protein
LPVLQRSLVGPPIPSPSRRRRRRRLTHPPARNQPITQISGPAPPRYVKTTPSSRTRDASRASVLLELASDYVDAINRRDLGGSGGSGGGGGGGGSSPGASLASYSSSSSAPSLSALLDEHATQHDDGMFQVRPIVGRGAVRSSWRDWLRAVPDFSLETVAAAACGSSASVFLLWRGRGTGRLPAPNLHQRPTTNLPFEMYGATRLRVDPATMAISDIWSWRGPTVDESEWLLARSPRAFPDEDAAGSALWLPSSSPSSSSSSSPARPQPLDRDAVRSAARTFRRAFGAVSVRGGDLEALRGMLAPDDAGGRGGYRCREATGVWRENELGGVDATVEACARRGREAAGTPFWQAEAVSGDGRVMFLHFQNVLTARKTRMVLGVSSGIAVHVFEPAAAGGGEEEEAGRRAAAPPASDGAARSGGGGGGGGGGVRLLRTLLFRGPASIAERAQGFTMDASAAGPAQAARRAFSLSKGATTLGAALATYSAVPSITRSA